MKTLDLTELGRRLARSKYVLLVLGLGLLLLLLPKSSRSAGTAAASEPKAASAQGDALESSGIPLGAESERVAELLRAVDGVGECRVLLSRSGAVVVCAGAARAEVRLAVTEAVSAYTGLGSDRVLVLEGCREQESTMREAG